MWAHQILTNIHKSICREEPNALKSVILIDEHLFNTDLGNILAEKLKDVYLEASNIKVCPKQLELPYSIQWLIPKRNSMGAKVNYLYINCWMLETMAI